MFTCLVCNYVTGHVFGSHSLGETKYICFEERRVLNQCNGNVLIDHEKFNIFLR